MVAPITSTIYGVPSEVRIGVEHGLKQESAINLDHVQTVAQSRLRGFIGQLSDDTTSEGAGQSRSLPGVRAHRDAVPFVIAVA